MKGYVLFYFILKKLIEIVICEFSCTFKRLRNALTLFSTIGLYSSYSENHIK